MPLSSAAFAFGLLLLVPSGWAAAAEKHSGAVVAADETQITIAEMGPWHGPSTQPMRHVFGLADTTKVALAERTRDGSDGWPWGFSEQSLRRSDLRAGDFVTVTTERRDTGGVAVTVLAVRPGSNLELPL